jgi:hypothetical protein
LVLASTGGPLTNVLVPTLARLAGSDVDQEAWGLLVRSRPGSRGRSALTVALTRLQLAGVVLTVINAVQTAVQQTRGRFVPCEALNLLASLTTLAMLAALLDRIVLPIGASYH